MIDSIEREVLCKGRESGTTWFHPRPSAIPGSSNRDTSFIMTLQEITGSDVFGHVHETTSTDLGRSWSTPEPIPDMGRKRIQGDLFRGVCDVVPGFHSQTGTLLSIGHDVYYRDNKLVRPLDRYLGPAYSVKDLNKGTWSSLHRFAAPDQRMKGICSSGCSQRLHLSNGDILLPCSWAPKRDLPRSVGTLLLGFDGQELFLKDSTEEELAMSQGRGLLEPSLTEFRGTYYLTIRAEDGHGYLSTSKDGLNWSNIKPWSWDNGQTLEMSTTQQHWLNHSEGLYLVYTRKSPSNSNVFRWRSPIYVARFDHRELYLVKETEEIVLPLLGDGINRPEEVARMGNFHTLSASPTESWVTVGETLPSNEWRGNLLLARINWREPNHLAPGF